MVIQNNISGLNSKRLYNKNSSKLAKSLEKLSSGYSINRAADDAAGFAVSEKMRSQIFGMQQSVKNCQDGISLIQTFEGALGETVAIIKRMKTLADQSANGTYDDNVDRNAVEIEYLHLCDEVNHIADTDFNGIVMLNGENNGVKSAAFQRAVNSAIEDSLNNVHSASFYSDVPQTALFSDISVQSAAFAAPKAGGTACGDFTVYGSSSDFSFDTASGVLTILGGDVSVEGTGAATANTIVVAKDKSANVTLRNVNIDVSGTDNACAFKIEENSTGNINIILKGNNTLISGAFRAGIEKNCFFQDYKKYGILTISGSGSIYAESRNNGVWDDNDTGAGIGGSGGCSSCNIIIESGNITAIGNQGAGIGGGSFGEGGNIVINGGNIIASSKYDAGIGGGMSGNGVDITINGGKVTAKGGQDGGAGIGGGIDGEGKNITINGGLINASSTSNGAGIGGGYEKSGQNIVINGGTIVAIGGGKVGIDAATVICSGAGIGSGGNCSSGSNIIINGGTVTAIGGTNEINSAAGIGGSDFSSDSNISISGIDTIVIAKGEKDAEDIGNGSNQSKSTVSIKDGLISEPYTYDNIINGTIIHHKKNADIPNPIIPDEPSSPDNPDKLIVSIPNAYGNASAKLTYTDNLILQTGARTKDSVKFTFSYSTNGIGRLKADLDCTAKGLGLDVLSLSGQESANYAIDRLDHALNKVSMIRATFGAAQNRLEHKIDNLNNTTENLTAAESQIRDANMAQEIMNFTKQQILTQASQSMLAQATSLPQQVLSLIGS